MENSNQFKVRLESYSHGTSSVASSEVRFNVMPTISETIAVEYQSLDPVHMPGSFYVYKGTKSSTYEIGEIRLISRTSIEASENQAIRNTLRGWTKPYFGFGTANGAGVPVPTKKGEWQRRADPNSNTVSALTEQDIAGLLQGAGYVTPNGANGGTILTEDQKQKLLTSKNKSLAQFVLTQSYANPATAPTMFQGGKSAQFQRVQVDAMKEGQSGKKFLGAPPEVLYLTAYSDPSLKDGQLDYPTNIYRIPVVITNLGITYPNDVDYIPTMNNEPFPIIMSITLSLAETHSPREFENFDLFKYRDGKLPGF